MCSAVLGLVVVQEEKVEDVQPLCRTFPCILQSEPDVLSAILLEVVLWCSASGVACLWWMPPPEQHLNHRSVTTDENTEREREREGGRDR